MKRRRTFSRRVLLAGIWLIAAVPETRACPGCRDAYAAAEQAGRENAAPVTGGYYAGLLLMATTPFVLTGGVVFAFARLGRTRKA